MAIVSVATLKGYFTTGKYPTQTQFENLIDSLRHVSELIEAADIDGLQALLDAKADVETTYDKDAVDLLLADKSDIGHAHAGVYAEAAHSHNYNALDGRPNVSEIAPASEAHTCASWEDVNNALNALGQAINDIITALNI